MAVELAEVAAGLPVAASFALAGGISSLREGRRRAALNEAMHELRRPLQALSLSLPVDAPAAAPVESSLRLATVALERLDREINGAALEGAVTVVLIGELIEEAARRWRQAASSGGGSLEVKWNGGETRVEGDRFDLSQALDNLLSNAIEHGGGEVRLEARLDGPWVCVSVTDTGAARGKHGSGGPHRDRRGRRGYGLRVVTRIARRHGGSFTLRRAGRGTEATLRLPRRWVAGEA